MQFTAFELLKLQPQDEVRYRDQKGTIHRGVYLGDYTRANQSFKFRDFGDGQTTIIELKNVHDVERR